MVSRYGWRPSLLREHQYPFLWQISQSRGSEQASEADFRSRCPIGQFGHKLPRSFDRGAIYRVNDITHVQACLLCHTAHTQCPQRAPPHPATTPCPRCEAGLRAELKGAK